MWFKIDDGWHSHPKVVGLSLAAAGLWAKAGSWCGDHLTDGNITRAAVKNLGGNSKLAAELVSAGLWHVSENGGWVFHEWHSHNPSRLSVLAERERVKKRVMKHRGNAVTSAVTNAVTSGAVTRPRPDPTRPIEEDAERAGAHEPSQPAVEVQEPRLVDGTISAVDVMRAWLARAEQCAGGPVSHPLHLWRDDYETIAAALNQLPADVRHAALAALGAWFWHAGSGPIASGRLRASRATPATLAKRITADLATAHEWWHEEGKATYGQ